MPKSIVESGYVNRFLSLRCSGDVLNACGPVNRAEKEITESYGVVNRLRQFALEKPMQYTLVDIGSGNCLTAVMAAHLLPFKEVIAVDRRPMPRSFKAVSRFKYEQLTITTESLRHVLYFLGNPVVITSTHGCGDLSTMVCNAFLGMPNVEGMVILPCCRGKVKQKLPAVIRQTLGAYMDWALSLAIMVQGNAVVDKMILSPCNCVVIGRKGEKK